MDWKFELLAGPFGDALDGPVWDGEAILLTRPERSEIVRFHPATREVSVVRRYTIRTTGLAIGPTKHLYGAQSSGRRIVHFKDDGSASFLHDRMDGQYHNHPHDLAVDSKGRIWFTDPYSEIPTRGPQMFPLLDHASVLRLARDRVTREWEVRRLTFDTTEPRGIALSPDERILYVSEDNAMEGGRREIRAYPIEEHGLGHPRVLHRFGEDYRGVQRGAAGLCTDRDGHLIAVAGSSAGGPGALVYVFDSSGRVVETQRIPEGNPTNCAFGGPQMDVLFVTTESGHLYGVSDTGYQGSPPPA